MNAVEVVNAFPGADGLRQFRDWLASPDEQLLELARGGGGSGGKKPRTGRGSAKKQQNEQGGSQAEEADAAGEDGQRQEEGEGEGDEDAAGGGGGGGSQQQEQQERLVAEFKRRHRGVRRNWEPPPSFPSAAVDAAYASPKVDASKDK